MSKALLLVDALEGAWLENQRDDVSVDEVQTELRRLDTLVAQQAKELEQLRAQRVPLTKQQIDQIYNDVGCRAEYLGAITRMEIVRAIEAAHGIHPLQRLADLSKEIGEKL